MGLHADRPTKINVEDVIMIAYLQALSSLPGSHQTDIENSPSIQMGIVTMN